ncbi:MAG: CoA-binding protein [Candidatus Proteinoplasmatales archaeon SG8-5]|nr:MAG: CoA-binding protein [Candidatus Proteinoplasmatales archaeon SG8-5]
MEENVCELPLHNAPSEAVRNILENYRTVAVVGLSNDPDRDSFMVARYLKENGYTIVPVNPKYDEVLGEKSYPSLREIPFPVDIVDIFRRADAVPDIVEDAIDIGAKVVWMQKGIVKNSAAERARAAGLEVVMDKCMKVEHKNL